MRGCVPQGPKPKFTVWRNKKIKCIAFYWLHRFC